MEKSKGIGKSLCVLAQSDNTLWSWGNNMFGELGINGDIGYRVYAKYTTNK